MGRNDHFIMPQTQQAKLILHNMKTDFIYLKGILKNNFFDTSCWEINRILYDKKYLNL